jgi:hypothetical protein
MQQTEEYPLSRNTSSRNQVDTVIESSPKMGQTNKTKFLQNKAPFGLEPLANKHNRKIDVEIHLSSTKAGTNTGSPDLKSFKLDDMPKTLNKFFHVCEKAIRTSQRSPDRTNLQRLKKTDIHR